MNIEKKKRLERAGWTVGGAVDFLRLSPEEAAFVELKLAFGAAADASGAGCAARVEPVAGRQDGGWRSQGFAGSADSVVVDAWR